MGKNVTWTEQKIFVAIKRRITYKQPLASSIVFEKNLALYQVCRRKYGSWINAVNVFLEANPEYKTPEVLASMEFKNCQKSGEVKDGEISRKPRQRLSKPKINLQLELPI